MLHVVNVTETLYEMICAKNSEIVAGICKDDDVLCTVTHSICE